MGKVYIVIIPDAQQRLFCHIDPDSISYRSFRLHNTLDVSRFHNWRINYGKPFADKQNHINGIENFWNQEKRHMPKFNGIKKEKFYWFLKECERLFNGGNHKTFFVSLNFGINKEHALAS